jgi:hypothetical protein
MSKKQTLEPMTNGEVTGYIQHVLFPAPHRLAILSDAMGRNRESLLTHPQTSQEIIDGLFGDCPYVNKQDAIRDLNALMIGWAWGWMPDSQDRWHPRTRD